MKLTQIKNKRDITGKKKKQSKGYGKLKGLFLTCHPILGLRDKIQLFNESGIQLWLLQKFGTERMGAHIQLVHH